MTSKRVWKRDRWRDGDVIKVEIEQRDDGLLSLVATTYRSVGIGPETVIERICDPVSAMLLILGFEKEAGST